MLRCLPLPSHPLLILSLSSFKLDVGPLSPSISQRLSLHLSLSLSPAFPLNSNPFSLRISTSCWEATCSLHIKECQLEGILSNYPGDPGPTPSFTNCKVIPLGGHVEVACARAHSCLLGGGASSRGWGVAVNWQLRWGQPEGTLYY